MQGDRAREPADRIGAFVCHQTGPAKTETLARHALLLEGAWDRRVRLQLEAARAHAVEPLRAELVAAGSADPDTHLRILLDHLDGMVLHQLAMPAPAFAPEDTLRLLLRALLG